MFINFEFTYFWSFCKLLFSFYFYEKIIDNFITGNSTYSFYSQVLLTKQNYGNWVFSDRKEQFVVDMELNFKAYNWLIHF